MTPPPDHSRGLLIWLWRHYLRRHLALLLTAMFFMALEGGMLGMLSWMMKPMFDRIFVAGDQSAIMWVGLAFMGIFVTLVFTFYLLKYGESAHTAAPNKRD